MEGYVTTILIMVLLVLPIIPAFVGAIYYIAENKQDDIRPFMVVVQWISPIIMTIELIIIYYTENFLGMRKIIGWFSEINSRPIKKSAIANNCFLTVFIVAVFGLASYYHPKTYFDDSLFIDMSLILTVLFTSSLLPLSTFLIFRFPGKKLYRGVRLVGRGLALFWIFNLILFGLSNNPLAYPVEFWIAGAWIGFAGLIVAASIYIWVFSVKNE